MLHKIGSEYRVWLQRLIGYFRLCVTSIKKLLVCSFHVVADSKLEIKHAKSTFYLLLIKTAYFIKWEFGKEFSEKATGKELY